MRRAWLLGIPLITLALLLCGAGITEQTLRTAQSDGGTWLSYGKNYAGWRYADLTQINRTNVARLTTKWMFQTGVYGKFETTPLVFDRLMFATGPSNHASTAPSLRLRTQPATPRSAAWWRVVSRNQTPWTRPWMVTWRAMTSCGMR